MKKIQLISFISSLMMLSSCSNLSVNTNQVNSTLSNIECYRKLVAEINNSENLKMQLTALRDSKKRGKDDPVTVKQKFRTVDNEELIDLISENWKNQCLRKINSVNDLTGIRYINDSTIIIEIDKFNRHTINEQYSFGGTMEIHRLIISDKFPNGDFYKFGTESIVWTENLGANWNYEVSQYQTVH